MVLVFILPLLCLLLLNPPLLNLIPNLSLIILPHPNPNLNRLIHLRLGLPLNLLNLLIINSLFIPLRPTFLVWLSYMKNYRLFRNSYYAYIFECFYKQMKFLKGSVILEEQR